MTKRNEEEIQIKPFSDFEKWRVASDRLTELKLGLLQREARDTEVQGKLNKGSSGPRLTALMRGALALITGRAAEQEDLVSLQEELKEIRLQRPRYELAIKLQQIELDKVKNEISSQICEPHIKPDENDLQEAGALMVKAGEIFRRLRARREALDTKGIRWVGVLRPFNFDELMNLDNAHSRECQFLREVSELGAVSGWQDPLINQPKPGAVIKVCLLKNMAGPDGSFAVGSTIESPFGDYLIRSGQARLAEPGAKLTRPQRAPADRQWGEWRNDDWQTA